MLSLEALRQAAKDAPVVPVPSDTLNELLDLAEKVKAKTKAVKAPQEVDPNDEKCARWLFSVVQKTAPKAREPNFTAWAKEVRLMRERDDRTHKEICELFKWAHEDRFWCANILSPAKLREHWDRLSIQRAKAVEPKARGDWWANDATKLAKAREVGVGPAHFGESAASWEARIRAAIDNGGKPPSAQVFVRPTPPANEPAPAQEQIRTAKAPGFLKEMLKQAQQRTAA
jgi:hypothetical protein